MKIAIVYDVVYPYGLGGGEKRNWEIARRLVKLGHDVRLVSMQMWEGEAEFRREGVCFTGVCRWKPALSVGGKRSFWEPVYFARHVFSYLKRCDADVVDCSNFPYLSCLAARLANLFRKTKLVITWYEVRGLRRWVDHRGLAVGSIAWLSEFLISRMTIFNMAISRFTEQRAREFLGLKDMAVVPCGVDFAALANAAGTGKKKQVLYVGRLTKYKRVDMLIDAFARISVEYPQYTLKIVGRGYERERLSGIAVEKGVSEKVQFEEDLSEEALYREYASSRVFVLPSEQEGFGIVLLEAMAVGTPVIALKAPNSAAEGLITSENDGLLVESVEELANALRRVISDDGLRDRLSVAGIETARRHDWDRNVIPGLEKYYELVIGH